MTSNTLKHLLDSGMNMTYAHMDWISHNIAHCCHLQVGAKKGILSFYDIQLLYQPLLSRITAYLEVKILSLLKHETLTTGKKILQKWGEIAPKENLVTA